ncbi:hypothetical protein EVAR_16184_1 [Eumeta japonica]|uniref:RNase H type-1 domain-containing protein n=1 Tax=Eumeta variegata TaxID=151549 RepID=A0A4C1WEG3_EUMVA|nr:hypothetical protein EVAR_16184_1 [Eumeta japonica]
MVMGYLRDREVVVRYAGGESRRMTSKGCTGLIAGPTFGICPDSPTPRTRGPGVYVQAFADDVVLMFSDSQPQHWRRRPTGHQPIELGNVCADRELERPVDFTKFRIPRTPNSGSRALRTWIHQVDRLAIVGRTYTDGSKIEGKAEMFALHRAIKRVKEGDRLVVNIFSDSKSSLQMLTAPKPTNLWLQQRQDIRDIVAEGREVRLFWVRAHAGTTGNERALTSSPGTPPSKGKRQRITIAFRCRTPKGAYRVLSRFTITPLIAQTLTGHGGFAQYPNRFKLKDSPYCACAPDKVQDVLHVLEECPIFGRERAETEAGTGVVVARHGFPALLDDQTNRKTFLKFCERVTRRCNKMNGSNIAYE